MTGPSRPWRTVTQGGHDVQVYRRHLSNLKPSTQGMMLTGLSALSQEAVGSGAKLLHKSAAQAERFLAGVPPNAKAHRAQNQLQRPTQLRRIGSVMYRVGKSSTGSHSLQRTETPRRILKPAAALPPRSSMTPRPQVRHAETFLALISYQLCALAIEHINGCRSAAEVILAMHWLQRCEGRRSLVHPCVSDRVC